MTQALTRTPAPHTIAAPHKRRPDETEWEHQLFWQWFIRDPRPAVPQELQALALDKAWLPRARVLDLRLQANPMTPDEAMRRGLADCAGIFAIESAEAHARALERPGGMRARDVASIGKLVLDAGAMAMAQREAGKLDFSSVTDEEWEVLRRADEIYARLPRMPGGGTS